MKPQRQAFVDALHTMFKEASARGQKSIEVFARHLHMRAGVILAIIA